MRVSHPCLSRVIVVLTNATDIFAGGEDYVLILARYLTRRGFTVKVVKVNDRQPGVPGGTWTVLVEYEDIVGRPHRFVRPHELRTRLPEEQE